MENYEFNERLLAEYLAAGGRRGTQQRLATKHCLTRSRVNAIIKRLTLEKGGQMPKNPRFEKAVSGAKVKQDMYDAYHAKQASLGMSEAEALRAAIAAWLKEQPEQTTQTTQP